MTYSAKNYLFLCAAKICVPEYPGNDFVIFADFVGKDSESRAIMQAFDVRLSEANPI